MEFDVVHYIWTGKKGLESRAVVLQKIESPEIPSSFPPLKIDDAELQPSSVVPNPLQRGYLVVLKMPNPNEFGLSPEGTSFYHNALFYREGIVLLRSFDELTLSGCLGIIKQAIQASKHPMYELFKRRLQKIYDEATSIRDGFNKENPLETAGTKISSLSGTSEEVPDALRKKINYEMQLLVRRQESYMGFPIAQRHNIASYSIVNKHLNACIKAGLLIKNASLNEFLIGARNEESEIFDPSTLQDHLCLAQWLMIVIADKFGIAVQYEKSL